MTGTDSTPAVSTGAAVPTGRVPRLIVVTVAGPVLTLMLLTSVFVLGEMAGHAPLTAQPPRNIAEAAGLGSGAEVLRMLRAGQNPMTPLPVRGDIISSEITSATALEAAIWSRRVRLLHLFDREGLLRDDEIRQHVACVATAIGFDDGVEYLFPGGFGGCDPDEVIRAIRARSQ